MFPDDEDGGGGSGSDDGGGPMAAEGGSGDNIGGSESASEAESKDLVVEQYKFELGVDAEQSALFPATYSDLDAHFGAALAQIIAHDVTRAKVPPDGCEWTLVAQTHEQLAGPHGRVARAAAGAADAASGGDGVLGAGEGGDWAALSRSDDDARLVVRGGGGNGGGGGGGGGGGNSVGMHRLKAICAGPLRVRVVFDQEDS